MVGKQNATGLIKYPNLLNLPSQSVILWDKISHPKYYGKQITFEIYVVGQGKIFGKQTGRQIEALNPDQINNLISQLVDAWCVHASRTFHRNFRKIGSCNLESDVEILFQNYMFWLEYIIHTNKIVCWDTVLVSCIVF